MSGPGTGVAAEAPRDEVRARRAPGLVLLCVLLIAGVVADGLVERDANPVPRLASGAAPPTVAPEGVLSSTWYCAAGTANPGGAATGSVVLANSTADARAAVVTVFAVEGPPQVVRVKVPPLGRASLRYADIVTTPYAGVSVEIDGGGVGVEQVVEGPLGQDAVPCVTAAGERWHIANGVTAKDATMLVAFLNPFPGDAIVDLSAATEEGPVAPGDLQGVVVPGRSVVVKDIGEHVRRREQVSVTAQTRSGRRLVVSRLQLLNGGGRSGLALTPGAAAAPAWYFPDGIVVPGITERYELYNPSDREAVIELSLAFDATEVEPFELTIPAGRRLRFTLNDQERVPKDQPHAVTIRSLNDVSVVAEQTVDAVAPAPRTGFFSTTGVRAPARRWVVPAGGTGADLDEWVVVQNLGGGEATLSVTGLAGQRLAIEGLEAVKVGVGRRVALRIGDHIKRGDLPLLVTSDQQVVLVRSLYRIGKPGISLGPGIALLERR